MNAATLKGIQMVAAARAMPQYLSITEAALSRNVRGASRRGKKIMKLGGKMVRRSDVLYIDCATYVFNSMANLYEKV
jgi:hypothetical protein